MSTDEKTQLELLMERPIAFRPCLARIGGGAAEGLFLSQLFYWMDKGWDNEGWIYKSQAEWSEETCLSRREQERARATWRGLGVLEEKKEGLPCRLYYRINQPVLLSLLREDAAAQEAKRAASKKAADQGGENVQTSMAKVTNWNGGNVQTYNTETTTETTSIQNATHSGSPPAQAQRQETSSKRKADPRRKTPAIQCAKAINDGKWPPKALWDDIIRILGPTPDGPKLANLRKEWVARGYNPNSWKWLVEWYPNGIPKNGSRPGGGQRGLSEEERIVCEENGMSEERWRLLPDFRRRELLYTSKRLAKLAEEKEARDLQAETRGA